MTDLNDVKLIGRLTRDLGSNERDFGYIGNGTARANVSIAVNRSKKQPDGSYADEVSYFDISIWGKTAENLKPYLLKGQQILVEGILKQERWEDKQTGEKKSKIAIHAQQVWLLGSKKDGQQNSQNGYQNQQYQNNGYQQSGTPQFTPAPQNQQPQNNVGYQPNNDFGSDFPEDIPF
ncbi:single-strand binding protein [Treponema bryantii]|uniref:Single-stranded DNA-binding protein n=1 Tax=Treponema bryantii TaxID=163 RepID=A0A1H9B3N5_9SPIR|nr:single-stranded DNA-binding protein [Treponema bryantii]SEP83455.1 single-strand binding protein [Treponema bryantii]